MANENQNNNKVNPNTAPDDKGQKNITLDDPDRNQVQPVGHEAVDQPDTGGQGKGTGDKGHMGLPREKERSSRG